MEAIYFFAGIAVLLAANYLAIRRINAKSYLRPPNSRIKEFWIQAREEQTSKPTTSEPPLSRPELREKKYVDWFTQGLTEMQRAEKARKAEAAQRNYEDEHPAFVGVAIVHEEPAIKDSKHKPEKNIDRWYRTAANG